MLARPPDSDWLMRYRNYSGWSHSPLNQITTKNVGNLQLKWAWPLEDGMRQQITPIVHDGVMFLSTNMTNTVQAMDARTGDLIWEHRLGPDRHGRAERDADDGAVRQLVVLSGNRRHALRARCTHREHRLEEQDVRVPRRQNRRDHDGQGQAARRPHALQRSGCPQSLFHCGIRGQHAESCCGSSTPLHAGECRAAIRGGSAPTTDARAPTRGLPAPTILSSTWRSGARARRRAPVAINAGPTAMRSTRTPRWRSIPIPAL